MKNNLNLAIMMIAMFGSQIMNYSYFNWWLGNTVTGLFQMFLFYCMSFEFIYYFRKVYDKENRR